MKLKDLFIIRSITNSVALECVIKHHYLHRKANAQKSFGLYEKSTDKLIGVAIYGYCASFHLRKRIFGIEEKDNIYELTRFWLAEDIPKNTASYFLGNTLKLLDKEIIVTFADPTNNHIGTIYQACNFYYTGLSEKTKDLFIKGQEDFNKTTFNVGTVAEIKAKYGNDSVYYVDRIRKHRYFYLNCSESRKKELLKKLSYEVLPFPIKVPINIIYGLYEPEEGGALRYIGQSSIGLERAWQHKKSSNLKARSHKVHWINSLISQKKMYRVEILKDLGSFESKEARDKALNDAEIELIAHHRSLGANLTNSTIGGEGTRGNVLNKDSRNKISKKRQLWLEKNELPEHLWETCYKRKEHLFINDMEQKHCSDCESYKPLEQFGKDKKQWDMLRTICSVCARKRKKDHYYQTVVTLSDEEWMDSYNSRRDKIKEGIKRAFKEDPTYRQKISDNNSKAVIGTSVDDCNKKIEFRSALDAGKSGLFNNSNLGVAIKTGKPYKGYYWKFK